MFIYRPTGGAISRIPARPSPIICADHCHQRTAITRLCQSVRLSLSPIILLANRSSATIKCWLLTGHSLQGYWSSKRVPALQSHFAVTLRLYPPLTVDLPPLAVFDSPPVTEERNPLAVLRLPAVTEAIDPLAVFA